MSKFFVKPIAFICALLLLGAVGAPVCYALGGDPFERTWIATEQELVAWYNSGVTEGAMDKTTEITGTVHLNPVGEKKVAAANYGLVVKSGGTLMLDNPELILFKVFPDTVPITVENGGRLTILQSFNYRSLSNPSPTIVIKEGGILTGAELLPQSVAVIYGDGGIGGGQPPVTPPTVEDGLDPIANTFEEDYRFSFVVGERPAPNQFPAAAYVAVLGYDEAPLLPLEWDLSYVNFDSVGTYSATGKFTQEGLDEHKLSNPKGFTMRMVIQVAEKGPPDKLRGSLLSAGPNGYTLIKLTLPALPMDKVTALYTYSSSDNTLWKQECWRGQPGTGVYEEETDFRSLVRTEGRSSAIPFRYRSDGKPVYIRVEVVGSEMAGISNSIHLETTIVPPEDRPPEEDENLGNRGGVGQEETERDLPPEDEAKKQAVIPTGAGQTDAVENRPGTANTSETADKWVDSPLEATPTPTPTQKTIVTEQQSPATPAIPGAVTAAVCTTGTVVAVSVLLRCSRKAKNKLIQRKP